MWAVNLGNFTLISETPKKNYEYYKLGISAVMMKFYKNYKEWET